MKKLLILFALGLWLNSVSAQKASDISGVWWNAEKTSKIEVVENNGEFIGTVVYIIPEKYENGQPPLDTENPDPSLRSRSRLGLQILHGLKFNLKEKEWDGGRIYDPKSGKTYDCYAWFEDDPNKLYLKGYVVGIKWLGRSTEWTKASAN